MSASFLRLHGPPDLALERGDLLVFPNCPFPLPEGEDREFLCRQRVASSFHKNISFDPRTLGVAGHAHQDEGQTARLRSLLATFSRTATEWVARLLPGYAAAWEPDRATLRPEEEATRRLRQTARNDLLHLDAFPSRPSLGRRILRLFVNIHESEPRVWVTSEQFARLLERYGTEIGLADPPGVAWLREVGENVLRLLQPGRPAVTAYDGFMRRFHHFLKAHDEFQERAPRQFWRFPPGSAWLVFTDGLSHAELRGQYALEHSYFIAPQSLALPEEAPAAIFERACHRISPGHAA